MKSFYTIMINGQKAVDVGYRFCGNSCYRKIRTHNKVLAQLEVVIDEPGDYNGNPLKWVSVSYIETGNLKRLTMKRQNSNIAI